MAKRKKSKREENITADTLKEYKHYIFQIFNNNPAQSYNVKQVAARMGVSDKDAVYTILIMLAEEGVIEKVSRGGFQLTRKAMPLYTGRVEMNASGVAYIVVEGLDKDIIVDQRNTHHAMHGDTVEVTVIARRRDGREEGEITRIIEQGRRQFVGRIEISERFAFVSIDSRTMTVDIFVPERHINGAQNGQKVVVKILEWSENQKNPIGTVVDVLGNVGDNTTEMHAILAEFELPYKFPEELEKQAEKISAKILKKEIAKRRDMRGVATFTIDPADAKDFDDALSLEKLANGNWEVGVHIADVTHYVREDTDIDNEAISRATSVYLVDRTVPMLPEKLSNFLCSLRPNEEKLCFSAIFELTDEGQLVSEWFGRTVILSDKRFSYEEAQAIIEGGEGECKDEMLILDNLAKKLRKERFRNGSIGFERDEAKFILDESGKPLGVYFKQAKDSNHLIEEFMLLANRRVAQFIGKKKAGQKERTFVYRIHDKPNQEKFDKFKGFISRFGYTFKADKGRAVAKELTKLLESLKGKKEENLISTLAIRSMAKAAYSTHNIGHYGLGFEYYTHFTSPIRRYPDMMVHRLLQHYLDGGKSAKEDLYEQLCEQSSAMEVRAAEAERASIKYKMVEFMEDKLGQEFDGTISGVTDWGLYVELSETHIEGMVALRDMNDDFYAFDAESYAAVGHNTGRRFTLGDGVRVRIKRADLARKQLDYEMVGSLDFKTKKLDALPTFTLPAKQPDFQFTKSKRKKRK